jgi:hypothetical protein
MSTKLKILEMGKFLLKQNDVITKRSCANRGSNAAKGGYYGW